MIIDGVPGLCVYDTILSMVILESALSTYETTVCRDTVSCALPAAASHFTHFPLPTPLDRIAPSRA